MGNRDHLFKSITIDPNIEGAYEKALSESHLFLQHVIIKPAVPLVYNAQTKTISPNISYSVSIKSITIRDGYKPNCPAKIIDVEETSEGYTETKILIQKPEDTGNPKIADMSFKVFSLHPVAAKANKLEQELKTD